MNDANDTLTINANIDIPVETLNTIVASAKQAAGADAKGIYRVDTYAVVSSIISKFLASNEDFMAFASDLSNYQDLT